MAAEVRAMSLSAWTVSYDLKTDAAEPAEQDPASETHGDLDSVVGQDEGGEGEVLDLRLYG